MAAASAPPSAASAMTLQTIAHELRQPLSAIESIAYYLNLVLPPQNYRAREQASRLQDLVEQAGWILTCALELHNQTPIAPEPVDVEELITQSVLARPSGRGAAPLLHLAGNLAPVRLDPGRGQTLMESLLSLFSQLAGTAPFSVETAASGDGVRLSLTASAAGRSPGALGPGSGVALACAQRIVEAHGGTLTLQVDPASGIVLTVVLP